MTINEDIQHSKDSSESKDDRRRARFVWLSDRAIVVACAVVFFGILAVLIWAFFPQGSAPIVDPDTTVLTVPPSGDVEVDIDADTVPVEQWFAGKILSIQRRVKHRNADALTWNDASVGDTLARNDAVQTFARSTATMQVNNDSHLMIGENSLIVFDQQEFDPLRTEQQSTLVMIEGELAGKLSSANKLSFQFNVDLPNSEVTLQPVTPGKDVEFLITVNDDQSTTVNIHEGTAQVVAPDGTLQTIDEQQSVTIDSSGSKFWVIELTPSPKATGPANNMAVTYRNVPTQIHFTWNAIADADRYHIVIARDKDFSDRVVDDDVVGTRFTHGALRPGTYYWYVRSRVGWSQSDRSAVRRLHMRQDLVAPTLELDPAPGTIQAGPWRLQGRTDPDAAVFIDEVPIEHHSGRIDHAIELTPGANIIVVTAVDKVGNLSYAPLLVNAK